MTTKGRRHWEKSVGSRKALQPPWSLARLPEAVPKSRSQRAAGGPHRWCACTPNSRPALREPEVSGRVQPPPRQGCWLMEQAVVVADPCLPVPQPQGPAEALNGLLSHQWVPRGHFCFYGCSCISRHLGFMFRLLLSSAKRCLEERRSFAPRRQP